MLVYSLNRIVIQYSYNFYSHELYLIHLYSKKSITIDLGMPIIGLLMDVNFKYKKSNSKYPIVIKYLFGRGNTCRYFPVQAKSLVTHIFFQISKVK
jgi:hypothetical protein